MTDPLLELVREYRQQLTAFNRSPSTMTVGEEQALAVATWVPLYDLLCTAPPNATTLAGAIEAVRLVHDGEAHCGNQPGLTINVLAAALAFFDKEAVGGALEGKGGGT